MTRKFIKKTAALCAVSAAVFSAAGCGSKAPEAISLAGSGYILQASGEDIDISGDVTIEGEGASEELIYAVSDEGVAEISDDGVLTAKEAGSAKLTVSSAADEGVSASADILVYDYTGVYTCTKYIDAMGCDIKISIKLSSDGTFELYRYPMYVNLEGGGRMEGMSDAGSYSVSGGSFAFNADYLGEFTLDFMLSDGIGTLSGETPTGGAATEMELKQASLPEASQDIEGGFEAGIYAGSAETQEGEAISYELTLDGANYELKNSGTGEIISKGSYYVTDDGFEFFADEGITFAAVYDASRSVVEGTEIPVTARSSYDYTSATLTLQ